MLACILALVLASVQAAPAQTITGYITVNPEQNGNLFYWVTESQGDPTKDPIVLWVSGGPGCSGALALFYENGPWTINSELKLIDNPYSWNKYATIIYIDQPVGTGYSYANTPYVKDEAGVAKDMEVFFVKFFERYRQYSKLEFYIAGESYGGKYVPTMARVIRELNKKDPSFIKLKGIAMGNGVVAPYYQTDSQGSLAYQAGLISRDAFHQIEQISLKCLTQISNKQWSDAAATCNQVIIEILKYAGDINPMYYVEHCKIQDCFVYSNVTNYLNLPDTKKALNIPANVSWETCNFNVKFSDEDEMESFIWQVEELLEDGLPVLSYYGDLDLVAAYPGGLKWMQNTNWHGKIDFNRAPIIDWTFAGKVVGKSKTYRNFVFLILNGGGHMAPHDVPEASLEMFRRFLKNEPF